jgi:hypothetical protein
MRLRPEEDAVLLCALAERDQEQQDRLRALLAGGANWDRVWATAGDQHIRPLVARAVASGLLASALPPGARKEAERVRLQTLFANQALQGELERIADSLGKRGIPVVPLKGTVLARRLYDDLDARQGGDVDILVPQPNVQAARAVLGEAGYVTATEDAPRAREHPFHGSPFVREGRTVRFVVELHWALGNPRFVTVDYAHLWKRILEHSSDREPLRPLPTEETLVYLAAHSATHHTGVLRLVVDIDRLVRREAGTLDWAFVRRLARRWSASGLLYWALWRSRMLLRTPLPPGMLGRLRPAAWREKLVQQLAGPTAILRPLPERVCYSRFRLAYSAMLAPWWRSIDAYLYYFFPPVPGRTGAAALARRVSKGAGSTRLVVSSVLRDDCKVR